MPPVSLRQRFLREYTRLSEPSVQWLTSSSSDPDATSPTGVPGGDFSIAGRGALAAQLADPTSLTNLGLSLMATLAPPVGTLAISAGKAAITAHNASALQAALAGYGRGQQILGEIARNQPRPQTFAEHAGDVGVAEAPDAGTSQGGAPSPGDNPDAFGTGGIVPDRLRRAGGEEVIRAHEGEFVVRARPAKKYRRLLEAINAGRGPDRIAALAGAM